MGNLVYSLEDFEDRFQLSFNGCQLCRVHFAGDDSAWEGRLLAAQGRCASLRTVLQFLALVRGDRLSRFGTVPVPRDNITSYQVYHCPEVVFV